MDADYSVFSLLPPYNTIHAQLIDANGELVRDAGGITVTYEAVADPSGSINSHSSGKTNFWQYVSRLFGVELSLEHGLANQSMPGSENLPQPMVFDASAGWWIAEGVPITAYDDSHRKNSYPLFRLRARNEAGFELARTDIVLPVSDEMDCRSCHASDSVPSTQPSDGWVHDPDPQRDMRLNILRLHDDREQYRANYKDALTTAGYRADGLYATATTGTPILCARCHASNALPGSGLSGIPSLTRSVHSRMAYAIDPLTRMPLESSENRGACYRCHPGAVTRCLRGAMGSAVTADGSLAIQCQNCHGKMSDVGSPEREGWLDEPTCQSCHTGTATNNAGALRYTSAYTDAGERRQAVDATFATQANTPSTGLSLFRFSKGHGGLACEACHGSTHAEFPSLHENDNLQSLAIQGHEGPLAECTACHTTDPNTVTGGPHGMHPVGTVWVDRHADIAESQGTAGCTTCHGSDYRGTVLSRSQADRNLSTPFGTKQFWRGFQIGCYACHNGPHNEAGNRNRPAVVSDLSGSTRAPQSVSLSLDGRDAEGNPLIYRIVTQPAHGRVGLNGSTAVYFPDPEFSGLDSFTYAAWDGSTDSNLAMAKIAVQATCKGDCDSSGAVSLSELLSRIDATLSDSPSSCGDTDGDGHVQIEELIEIVRVANGGC